MTTATATATTHDTSTLSAAIFRQNRVKPAKPDHATSARATLSPQEENAASAAVFRYNRREAANGVSKTVPVANGVSATLTSYGAVVTFMPLAAHTGNTQDASEIRQIITGKAGLPARREMHDIMLPDMDEAARNLRMNGQRPAAKQLAALLDAHMLARLAKHDREFDREERAARAKGVDPLNILKDVEPEIRRMAQTVVDANNARYAAMRAARATRNNA